MSILTKLFTNNKIKPAPPQEERQIMPLRIVQAGGSVECYYMALPAEYIMERHPRSVLARPEVFREPWDSIVRTDEILTPGEKFYLVPRGTVRKLRRRFRQRPSSVQSISDSNSRNSLSKTKMVKSIDTWQPSLVAIDE